MTTVTDSAPEMTLADLIDKFGPIPIRRIRQDPEPGTATEEDVVTIWDREKRLYELVDGILVEKTMGYEESVITIGLVALLDTFVRRLGLGIVSGTDGLMRLALGLVRIPDIGFVSWERIGNRFPKGQAIAPFGPELAIEVLSRSNTRKEMSDKLADYFAAGARLVWYIDPRARTVTVHESPERATVLRSGDTLTGGYVLPGFEVAVDALLTLPEPPAATS
ncbi:MAG TPA: Uma2 family endonuclease [Isosphaeraceae bacterium]|jgi:Uma2 family endonuclease